VGTVVSSVSFAIPLWCDVVGVKFDGPCLPGMDVVEGGRGQGDIWPGPGSPMTTNDSFFVRAIGRPQLHATPPQW